MRDESAAFRRASPSMSPYRSAVGELWERCIASDVLLTRQGEMIRITEAGVVFLYAKFCLQQEVRAEQWLGDLSPYYIEVIFSSLQLSVGCTYRLCSL
jgi:hypothetical protein